MKAFVECRAGSNVKNRYDERSLRLKKSSVLRAAYPLAYGFIVGTKGGDGDCVDCFVMAEGCEPGTMMECEPIAMFRLMENDEPEYKVFVSPAGEERAVSQVEYERVKAFLFTIFGAFDDVTIEVGPLQSREETMAYLGACRALDAGEERRFRDRKP